MSVFLSVAALAGGLLGLYGLRRGYVVVKKWRTDFRRLQKLNDKMTADLDERRAIERELAHMASFSEMAPAPIIETDTTGNLHYLNPAALAAFPTLAATWSKHPVFEGIGAVLDSLKREGKAMTTRPIKVGERIYDEQISLLDGGPAVRLYFSDITELKRLDQLKTDFVNMVSHELRSPLTTINASIRMIVVGMLGATTQDQQAALALASESIERLGRLINELLDISKIEAGKLELHCRSEDINEVAEEVVRNFAPLAQERGLALRGGHPEAPQELFIDRDKIVQVFTNLTQNALKFTEKGGVAISIQPDPEGVRCEVADTGRGISAEDLPKVFGKFQQFGAAPHGREKGTGLGLSLCKGFVELHGGRIWVESEKAAGSKFIFVLPRQTAEGIFKEQVARLLQDAGSHGRPLTLVNFTLDQWKLTLEGEARQKENVTLQRLEAAVKSALGVESVVVSQRQSAVWLALPEMAKAAARDIVSRVQKEWTPPQSLHVTLASYPEDGSLPEQLLERLTTS